MDMLLIETVGGRASNAGKVVHVQPVAGTEAIDLIAAGIRHPDHELAEAVELVSDMWTEWVTGGRWRKGDDFTLHCHPRGPKIFTVWGSADLYRQRRWQ